MLSKILLRRESPGCRLSSPYRSFVMLGIGQIWGCPKCWSIWDYLGVNLTDFSPRKGNKCHQMSQDEPNCSPAAESEATCRVWVFIRFRGTSLTTSIFQAASNLWPLGAFGLTAMNMWLALAAKRFDFILSWVFLFRFRQVFRSLEVLCFFPSCFSTRKLPRSQCYPPARLQNRCLQHMIFFPQKQFRTFRSQVSLPSILQSLTLRPLAAGMSGMCGCTVAEKESPHGA